MVKKLWIPSPFYRSRGTYPIDMMVIHHIGSSKGKLYSLNGTITWFTNEEVHRNEKTGKIENKVSSHYIIPRAPYKDHDVVYLVDPLNVAYHAGYSQWIVDGVTRKNINNYSIGVELEGDGNLVEYTDHQYDTLIAMTRELMIKYDITESNIVGHEDVSPDRKVDPGKLFDWMRYRKGIQIPKPTVIPVTAPTAGQDAEMSEHDEPVHMQGGEDDVGRKVHPIMLLLEFILRLMRTGLR